MQAPTIAPTPSAASSSRFASARSSPNTSTPNAGTSQPVQGWADFVKTSRVCSVGSCANVLDPGWPWRRCADCKAAGKKRSAIVPCSSCSMALTVNLSVAQSGQPQACTTCRQRTPAAQPAIVPPGPPLVAAMGPPPPRSPTDRKRKLSASIPGSPILPKGLPQEVYAFVHPDHLRALLRDDGAIPPPVFPLEFRIPAFIPSGKPSPAESPHYGPHGEICAPQTPATLGRPNNGIQISQHRRAGAMAAPIGPPHKGRAAQEIIIIPDLSNTVPSLKDSTDEHHKADSNKQKAPSLVKPAVASPLSADVSSAFAATRDGPVPSLKRKRTSHPAPPKVPKERVCASRSCGRQLPPSTQGELCADCSFLLWRKQFRARVAGLTTQVSSETQEPQQDAIKATKEIRHAKGVSVASTTATDVSTTSAVPAVSPAADVAKVHVSSDSTDEEDEEPLSVLVARNRLRKITDSKLTTKLPTRPPSPVPCVPPPVAEAPVEDEPLPAVKRPRVRLILRLPPAPPPAESDSEEDVSDSHSSTTSSASSPITGSPSPSSPQSKKSADPLRIASLAWDSDDSALTPLEELTDQGESEVNSPESEDEVPPTPKDSVPFLQSQAPWPAAEPPPPPPPPPPKHHGICAVSRCMNLLVESSRLRFCQVCRLRKQMIRRRHRDTGGVTQDEVVDTGMVVQMPANGDLTGYRRCSKKHCKRLIPPEADYKWKMCPPCRIDARNRIRLARAVPANLLDSDAEDAVLPTPPAVSRVASRHKGASKKSHSAPTASLATPSDPAERLPDVTAYQHFAALLNVFGARFHEFTVAQAHYLRFKAHQQQDIAAGAPKPRRNPIMFRFDGEYSIVADPSGGPVDALVHTVLRNVQAAIGLPFTPVGVNPGPEGSVTAVLRCLYGARIQTGTTLETVEEAEAPADGGSSSAAAGKDSLLVKMVGELQICVAWDRRHLFFPGQRIMVRFRLVG